MANHTPVEPDPETLESAQLLWDRFVLWSKRGTIAVCVVLALMAVALL